MEGHCITIVSPLIDVWRSEGSGINRAITVCGRHADVVVLRRAVFPPRYLFSPRIETLIIYGSMSRPFTRTPNNRGYTHWKVGVVRMDRLFHSQRGDPHMS